MTPDPARLLRLLVLSGLAGIVASVGARAQSYAIDPYGLYGDDTGAYLRPSQTPRDGEFRRRVTERSSTPSGLYDDDADLSARVPRGSRPGDFRRRIPEGTTSRFAPSFRGYMRESGFEPMVDDPTVGLQEQVKASSPFGFGDDDEYGGRGFRPDQSASRFGEPDQAARQDSYVQYLKERDPTRRAELYREYLASKSRPSGDAAARTKGSFSSRVDSSTPPPGFGLGRRSSITRDATSSSTSSSSPTTRRPATQSSPLFSPRTTSRPSATGEASGSRFRPTPGRPAALPGVGLGAGRSATSSRLEGGREP